MKELRGEKVQGLLALLISIFFISIANAASEKDLIVRFRDPLNSESHAKYSALKSGAGFGTEIQIVNAEEGVAVLKFDSQEETQAALQSLSRSSRVLNVTENHWYRPALHYQFQEQSAKERVTTPLYFPMSELLSLSDMPEVQLPPLQVSGPDPLVSQDWALSAIRLNRLVRETASPKFYTAVIDTGIDYNHEDLIAAMWRKEGDPAEVGYDFAHDHARPYDAVHFDVEGCLQDELCKLGIETERFLVNPGHGTHCAGHVAAVLENSLGMRGVGAQAKVMALKFFYDFGEERAGGGDDAAGIRSIDYALKNGVKVINASWGSRVKRGEAESSELKQALLRAQKAGVIVVVAAGNDGVDQDAVEDPVFPAAYSDLDNLIVVAATDQKDQLASFSNYGSKSVHIGAPGAKILSTTVGNQYADVIARVKLDSGKTMEIPWNGTSMAAPIVTGAVALVWSKFPNEDYRQIRSRVLKSARYLPALDGKVTTSGILNVAAALRY